MIGQPISVSFILHNKITLFKLTFGNKSNSVVNFSFRFGWFVLFWVERITIQIFAFIKVILITVFLFRFQISILLSDWSFYLSGPFIWLVLMLSGLNLYSPDLNLEVLNSSLDLIGWSKYTWSDWSINMWWSDWLKTRL